MVLLKLVCCAFFKGIFLSKVLDPPNNCNPPIVYTVEMFQAFSLSQGNMLTQWEESFHNVCIYEIFMLCT